MRGAIALAAAVLLAAVSGCGGAVTTPTTTSTQPTTTPVNGTKCGKERWAVKTLTDAAASQVALAPRPAMIAQLAAVSAPHEPSLRVSPLEVTTYQITGTLTFAKGEADSDYHLVIDDGRGHTMIVESPNSSCAAGSRVASQIRAVRASIDVRLPGLAAGQVLKPNLAVTVTGVGFFDRIHGQTGVAPNGVELHPILSIAFSTAHAHGHLSRLVQRGGTD